MSKWVRGQKIKGEDGYTPIKGIDYFDGKKPTDIEIENLIKPLIPKPIPGNDGSPDTPFQIRDKLESISLESEKLGQNAVSGLIDTLTDIDKELEKLRKQKGDIKLFGGGSGLTQATADARYLMLNTSNDPLTGTLTSQSIVPSTSYAYNIGDTTFTTLSAGELTSVGTTATVNHTAHGYTDGEYITISGANQAAYNGSFTITVVNANSFTYELPSDPANTATGTITMNRNFFFNTLSLYGENTNSIFYPDSTNWAYAPSYSWFLGGGSSNGDGVNMTWYFKDARLASGHVGNNLIIDLGATNGLSSANTFVIQSRASTLVSTPQAYTFEYAPSSPKLSVSSDVLIGSSQFTIEHVPTTGTTMNFNLSSTEGSIRVLPATGRFFEIAGAEIDVDVRVSGGYLNYRAYSDFGAYSNLGQWTFGSGGVNNLANPTVTGAYFTIRNPLNGAARMTVSSNYATFMVDNSQSVQGGVEEVKLSGNVTTIASAWFKEPNVNLNGNTLTNSATLYIETVATEATNNYAVWVDTGTSRFDGDLTFATSDSTNIILGTTTGTKVGTATTQKLGFWNATPVVQPSAYTQTYSTATKTHSNLTSATLTDSSGGTANTTVQALTDPVDTPATADALRDDLVANLIPELRNNFADLTAQVNALRVDIENAKQVLNSVIDDDQAIGIKA